MSVESMAIALNHSRATGTAKLVLIGIANHDGDGGAWPSVATLARYAGTTPRSVQRAVDQLIELHEVRRHIQKGGTGLVDDPRRPNLYEFLLQCPADCDRSRHHRTRSQGVPMELSTGVTLASPGDAGVRGGVTPVSPKPTYNPTSTPKKKTPVPDRARAACGHDLIDDRHCDRGCATARVIGDAA